MKPTLAQPQTWTTLALIFVLPAIGAGIVGAAQPQPDPIVYYRYPELLILAVSFLAGTVCLLVTALTFFLRRTLTKIDANQTTLFDSQAVLAKELHILQGEHRGMMARCEAIPRKGARNGI